MRIIYEDSRQQAGKHELVIALLCPVAMAAIWKVCVGEVKQTHGLSFKYVEKAVII